MCEKIYTSCPLTHLLCPAPGDLNRLSASVPVCLISFVMKFLVIGPHARELGFSWELFLTPWFCSTEQMSRVHMLFGGHQGYTYQCWGPGCMQGEVSHSGRGTAKHLLHPSEPSSIHATCSLSASERCELKASVSSERVPSYACVWVPACC